jgi:hypothetical protein
MIALLLVLFCCDDAAQAGAAYRDALEAIRKKTYDDAIAKLQEALRYQPRETDRLIYRDRDGRHREAYYPHYFWAQARSLQARGEANAAQRQEHLREAQLHLELSEHPETAGALESVKREITDLEKATAPPPALDPALTALRVQIATLCDQERFGEASRIIARESALLDRNAPDRAQLLDMIDRRRSMVLARHDRALLLTLETLSSASPLDSPETIPPMIQPVQLPATVTETPAPVYRWLQEFQALFEGELPTLRNPDAAGFRPLLDCAGAFDRSASRACAAGTFAGFRAAMNVSDSLRTTRLALLKDGRDDAQLTRAVADWEQSLSKREPLLAACAAAKGEAEAYRTTVLAPRRAALSKIRERMEQRTRLRQDLDLWISGSEQLLEDRTTMAHPSPLRTALRDASSLEAAAVWEEIGPGPRSKALYSHAVLELVLGLLEDAPADPLRERVGALLRSARALDPDVDKLWKDRLSPKLKAWLPPPTPR